MEVVYPRCCGLSVQKKKITACVLVVEPEGSRSKALATFVSCFRETGSPRIYPSAKHFAVAWRRLERLLDDFI